MFTILITEDPAEVTVENHLQAFKKNLKDPNNF